MKENDVARPPVDAHVLDDLPAYVLGALEPDDARRVAEHVAGCFMCRAELEEYQGTADAMLLAASPASPPPDLKRRLVGQVRSSKVERPARSTGWRPAGRLVRAGAFAGLALIAILVLSNFLLWQKLQKMDVLSGPLGMRAVALQNTDQARAASGFVVIGADGMNGVLVVDKLPPLDADHEYQLWLKRAGQTTSAAVFPVDESGYRGMRIMAAESLLTYDGVFVTVEPAGGSDQPTGEEVLNGSLFNSQR